MNTEVSHDSCGSMAIQMKPKSKPSRHAGRNSPRRMHTKGTTARHPYTCGSIPQHNTLQHQSSKNRHLVRWASQVTGWIEWASNSKNARRWNMLTTQRSLHPVLSCCLCTAHSTRFCLLCCQPVPVRRLSCARTSQLTLWNPCALWAC